MREYVPQVKYISESVEYHIFVGKVITKFSFYDRIDALRFAWVFKENYGRYYEYYNEKANRINKKLRHKESEYNGKK